MALNRSLTTVGRTGEAFYLPTESDEILTDPLVIPVGAKSLGLFSADGVTESDTASTSTDYAWQDNQPLNEFVSEPSSTIAFNAAETMNRAVIEAVYNTIVDEDGTYTIDPGAARIRRTFFINMTDGSRLWRIWMPSVTIGTNGDVTHTSTATSTIPVIVTGFKKLIGGVEYGPKVVSNPALITV